MSRDSSDTFVRWFVCILFAVLLGLGLFFVYKWTTRVRIDPASYVHAGQVVKDKFPDDYIMYSDDVAGRLLYGKGYITDEQRFTLKSAGLSDADIDNLVVKLQYSQEELLFYYIGFISVWAILFAFMYWSIDRLPFKVEKRRRQ